MHIIKTIEKVLVWMHRNKVSGQDIAKEIGITRQAWSNKLNNNVFTPKDLMTIKRLGFKE